MIGNSKPNRRLYDHPSDMEPLLPEDVDGALAATALTLIRRAEHLRGALHPVTGRAVAELVRSMNSYYSNLIEGHRTTPRDIEAALAKNFSSDAVQRALQMEHVAHLEVQCEMEDRLHDLALGEICTTDFLCWLHRRFYEKLPVSLRLVEDGQRRPAEVAPGGLRQTEVSVGRHVAPASAHLEALLVRFAEFYGPRVKGDPHSLIAAAAAHHRLVWIHPFLDGNGRVARLFSQAWLAKTQTASDGLWTLSRGLARRREEYRTALANADAKRINDFDGRGSLSQRYLADFCQFFLQTAVDQVEFMQQLLDLDQMQNRILSYAARLEGSREMSRGAGQVLTAVFLRGELPRGEVHRLMGASPRTAQKLTAQLLAKRLVVSDTRKGRLRLAFPADAAGYYFPNLYPAGTA